MPPDVKTIFEILQEDVIWVHAKWRVFRQLFATNEKRIAILDDFGLDFFQIVPDGLVYDILLTMSRLTDPAETFKRENLTLSAPYVETKRGQAVCFDAGLQLGEA